MSLTAWKWRLFLFVRGADATAQNAGSLAQILVDNGSLESLSNEMKMFDATARFSTTGQEPAQVYGTNIIVTHDMRQPLQNFIAGLTQARYYVVMTVDTATKFKGELVASNKAGLVGSEPWDITPFSWEDALQDIFDEWGLQEIEGAV